MADTTTSALTAASALTGTEAFPVVQSGSKKALLSQVLTYIKAALAAVATSGAYADLTGKPPLTAVATTDPGAANDNTQGYAVGSRWFNSVNGNSWECFSAATGAAIWLRHDYADHPGYSAGNFYPHSQAPNTSAGVALPISVAKFIPFIPKQDITISALGARISTVGTTNFQLAVYASTLPAAAAPARPTGPALVTTGNLVNTSATTVTAAITSLSLQAGVLYWLAINNGDSAAIFYTPTGGYMAWAVGASSFTSLLANSISALSTPLTFGTWSDVTAATWTEMTNGSFAAICFKVASIP